MIKTVDSFIEPIKLNSDIISYRMYMCYNGVDYCYLFQDEEAAYLGSSVKREMNCYTDNMTFTDYYGLKVNENTNKAIVGYVTGLDNIAKSLFSIACACKSDNVEANYNVHLNGKSYKIVRNNKNHKKDPENNSLKDVDFNQLMDLDLAIDSLNQNLQIEDQKRR